MRGFWWECGMGGSSTLSEIAPVADSLISERSVKCIGGLIGLAPAGPGVVAVQNRHGKNRISFVNLEKSKTWWTGDRELLHYRSAYVAGHWIASLCISADPQTTEAVIVDANDQSGAMQSLIDCGKWPLPLNPLDKFLLYDSASVYDPKTRSVERSADFPADFRGGEVRCFTDGLFSCVSDDAIIICSSHDGHEIARCLLRDMHHSSGLMNVKACRVAWCRESTVAVRSYASAGHYSLIGYDLTEQRTRWRIPHIAVGDTLRPHDPTTLDGDEVVFVGTPMPGTADDRSSEAAFVRACKQYAIIRVHLETGTTRTVPLQGEHWDRGLMRPGGHLCMLGYTVIIADFLDRDVPRQWVLELYRNADGAKISERWFKGVAAACVWRDQVVVANGNRLEILARQDAPA